MSVREVISSDLKTAMKARDSKKVQVLRLVQAALKNKIIEIRPNELTEEDVTGVLKKLVKQRKDSIEQFSKAGRQDLVDIEAGELLVIEGYLPEQMGEDQVKKLVLEAIQETGASSMKDMGAVMKSVLLKTQGNADNKIVSQLVRENLA